MSLKWKPKDSEGNIGVPNKGFIKASDFSQEDLDNLIKRAKNRKLDVNTFLLNAGLVPSEPQLELSVDEPRAFEKESDSNASEVEAHEQPKPKRASKSKLVIE